MPEADPKQSLLAAYRRLMRPLVRLLLRSGLSYEEFAEVSKAVFIDVASRDFQVPDRKMTNARIAIVTGLTRKEVSRVLQKQDGSDPLATNLGRVMRLLSGWHTDPTFTGPYGLPLEIPYDGNGKKNFLELAKRHGGDMPARALLDELLRIKVAEENSRGHLKVLTRTYMPTIGAPEGLDRMASTVRRFIETVEHNRTELDPDRRLFERTVIADEGIRVEDMDRFNAFIRMRAQGLLEEIDNWIQQLETPPRRPEGPRINTGLGIYHFIKTDD